MRPIAFHITADTHRSAQDLCAEFLDTERWPEFKGYLFLPGVQSAEVVRRTAEVTGTRIRVRNTDGSSHVEEVIAWDVPRRIVVKFVEFQPPLARFADHFIESWEFAPTGTGTRVIRTMRMVPKGWLGWLALRPIAFLMKKAFENHLRQW